MKLALATLAVVATTAAVPAQTVRVGQPTYGLAASSGALWVGGLSGDVVRIDPKTGKVTRTVAAGPRMFNLASAPGAVWAVSNVASTAVRIDSRTGEVTNTVPVGLAPFDVEWGFGSAWVSSTAEGTVTRITGGRVAKKIKVGTEPNGLTAYRGSLWVSDHTLGKVVRIDPHTNRITGSVKLAGADWITGLGDALYVSEETNVVARVDVRTLEVTGVVKVARNPLGSAVVGGKLWVPCIDASEIDVVDPATMKVVARRKAPLGAIVVLPAFGHTWVSSSAGNALWRL